MIDKATIRTRILARITRDPKTGCWIYLGCWDGFTSEARMRVGGKVYNIRKVVAWVFKDMELWEPGYVYRICQCPACCNPRHVRIAKNVHEALADMRRRRLFNLRGHRKLRANQRASIATQLRLGISVRAIAEDQRLDRVTVRRCQQR